MSMCACRTTPGRASQPGAAASLTSTFACASVETSSLRSRAHATSQAEILASSFEQLLSVRAKNLAGFYVIPDGSFNFDEADLK